MYTIIETAMFRRYAEQVWQDDEREAFIAWLASDPLVGDVIPGTGGVRKVRWRRQGSGKRGGARVIYYNTLDNGQVWLLIVYSKSKFDNLPTSLLTQLKEELNHG
ncbi:transcriptional regulator [Halomonas sp. 328]|uniref:transcriptional regulator n=1 Tax=Halomonas sp. 328 TaxID=2776704 RepID=UPI0018A7B081|nr:transcriptional regulator [Halomonas sp. 328]MBF8224500.1 transcriptional regulator [Halomonas sp. 328]